jgi:23S rRNA pseudouridine1911/1915/1917 synthase
VRAKLDVSWGRARDLIKRGKIALDGRTVTDPTARVREGAAIDVDLAARDPRAQASMLPREALVFSDPHVVVVNKPSGISTMPYDAAGMAASIGKKRRSPDDEVTLVERVSRMLDRKELGVVHRLDKETSGLLVFTRSWAAKKELMQAFRFHHDHRRYLALVHGLANDETIETHFVEDRGDGLRGSVEHRRGRKRAVGSEQTQRAVTHVTVIERFERAGASLVACQLETGRTHQIRIHLSERKHPVLGERVYIRDWDAPTIPSPRVMLHAAELGFTHPATGEDMKWEAPPPADFEEMLTFLRS